ncbi:MAG: tryptophan halogenase family protein [Pseudomonadota bacterium]|nr:tryptophan halogenase family protein [Pseudomonadota bacterium]
MTSQPGPHRARQPRPGRRIVIVGGGTAGWMTAAALSRFCDTDWSITLVESDAIGTIGVGEATIPMIRNFNAALGIDEAEFIAATNGTYKLGIEFVGWGAPDSRYLHAFGLVGRGLGLLPFQHYWLRARAEGLAGPIGDYVLNAVACRENRFAHVERQAGSPLPPLPFAYHFDAGLYAAYLRRYAEARGVVRVEGRIDRVETQGETGHVAAVRLENGQSVAGDLFVDCSGFRGLLIEETLRTGWTDWSHWLPCDRAIAVPCEPGEPWLPYTRATAREAGWQWRIPLQNRLGNGHVFCSAHIDEDAARDVLLTSLDGAPTAEPRLLRFTTGMRRQAWNRNVVAIGLSSGFLEPLESTSIHLIQTGIDRLLDYLPVSGFGAADRENFNRRAAWEMERIRDFIILHYHANGREGQPFWDALRHMAIPDTLAEKLAMFRAGGKVVRDHDELFDVPGWVQVMLGQGIEPQAWHPLADQLSREHLGQFLDTVRNAYARDVARMPDHQDYVSRLAEQGRRKLEAAA